MSLFYILDKEMKTVHTVDFYESLIWTDRYQDAGNFEIYSKVDQELLKYAQRDYYLWSSDSDHMMIIDGREIETDVEEGSHLKIVGESLESLLKRRIIWQLTTLTGNLQNGIKKLITDALLIPEDTDRRAPLIFEDSTDPAITELTIDTQFTGDNLFEAIKELCVANHIGFQITRDDNDQFIFKLYKGINRSYSQTENSYVVFSPSFDNIVNSNYLESTRNLKTIALVAGEGEELNRTTAVVGEGSGWDRRELYVDARDLTSEVGDEEGTIMPPEEYKAMLIERGKEYLAENKEIKEFDGEVDSTRMFTYGKDFFLGDTVQLSNEYGIESTAVVSELVISHSTTGYKMVPTFSNVDEEELERRLNTWQ